MNKYFMGVDIGSISTKIAILNDKKEVVNSIYLETEGYPIEAIKKCLLKLKGKIDEKEIKGIGCTGSGRYLASVLIGGDIIKNEITAQAIAGLHYNKNIKTLLEIGGQDSKVILLENEIPIWHNLNSLCAAGTGSFLTHQAKRLKIPIEQFGEFALKSKTKVNISGKCSVFAESDMIHKANRGYAKEDIIAGLCSALTRNFLNNVTKNRELKEPIIFSGGVASNIGVVKAFEEELKCKIIVPKEHKIMGCIGAALLVMKENVKKTNFKGFNIIEFDYKTKGFECQDCPNYCEIVRILKGKEIIACWGSRCGKWNVNVSSTKSP